MPATRKLLEARILTGVMTAYAQQERIEALTFDGTCIANSRKCLEESYRLLRRVDRQLAKLAPPGNFVRWMRGSRRAPGRP